MQQVELTSENKDKIISRKTLRQEIRRQRHEEKRRLERYINELEAYRPKFQEPSYELSKRFD